MKSKLTNKQKRLAYYLHEEGYTMGKIAHLLDVSQPTISNCIKMQKLEGETNVIINNYQINNYSLELNEKNKSRELINPINKYDENGNIIIEDE
ncbi:helix-turn-helix domain-containing protein [Clostridium thermobutyricum]|uniref:helix-turn-helix domain-containing protein n=1 Tax=Clostridium thermobutyricum TaxID=29372 RepID=UPI0018AC72AE|nr:helix-turn-helix domain-containing protein [Clostridium thermobutyricum]